MSDLSGGLEPPTGLRGAELHFLDTGRKLQGGLAARSRSALAEAPIEWQSIRFPLSSQLRAEPDWRVREAVGVAGLNHYKAGVDSFFYAAWQGMLESDPIEVVRQPLNGYDPHRVAVYGRYFEVVTRRFRKPERIVHRVQIGNLPQALSLALAEGGELFAELVECAWLPGEADTKIVELNLYEKRDPARQRREQF